MVTPSSCRSQAAQQLRFVRQWSVFGKTFQKSAKELAAAALAFTVLLLAYAQLGFLVSTCKGHIVPRSSPRHDGDLQAVQGALSATGQVALGRGCVCDLSLSQTISGLLLRARAVQDGVVSIGG